MNDKLFFGLSNFLRNGSTNWGSIIYYFKRKLPVIVCIIDV